MTVAILLKDDYFVSGAGLPGRFKAEKVEFHWGHSNGSAGSEHSVNGRRFPVEVRETGDHGILVVGGCVLTSVILQARWAFPAFLSGNPMWRAQQRASHSLFFAIEESRKVSTGTLTFACLGIFHSL